MSAGSGSGRSDGWAGKQHSGGGGGGSCCGGGEPAGDDQRRCAAQHTCALPPSSTRLFQPCRRQRGAGRRAAAASSGARCNCLLRVALCVSELCFPPLISAFEAGLQGSALGLAMRDCTMHSAQKGVRIFLACQEAVGRLPGGHQTCRRLLHCAQLHGPPTIALACLGYWQLSASQPATTAHYSRFCLILVHCLSPHCRRCPVRSGPYRLHSLPRNHAALLDLPAA